MAYKITNKCENCGACVEVCPVGSISETDGKYVIDADSCVDCGTCAEECPANAIEEA
ncbi:4Fe-4S dicluster domain-containing protein [bacterium]|nr:MAG: 4Fe-4S dicluster domain-containing protein [bacterium]